MIITALFIIYSFIVTYMYMREADRNDLKDKTIDTLKKMIICDDIIAKADKIKIKMLEDKANKLIEKINTIQELINVLQEDKKEL